MSECKDDVLSRLCFVYWVKLPEHSEVFNEGYIGITQDLKKRMQDHIIKSHKKCDEMRDALTQDKYEVKVLAVGDRGYCYELEGELRPKPNIGWNIAKGGVISIPSDYGINAKLHYSEVKNKSLSVSGWSSETGFSVDFIRKKIRNNPDLSLDQILGFIDYEEYTKDRYNYDDNDELLALYYLENTAMTQKQICKKLGWKDPLIEFFKSIKVCERLLTHVCVPVLEDRFMVEIPRQRTIHDFSDISRIYENCIFDEPSVSELSRELGYSRYVITGLIKELKEVG